MPLLNFVIMYDKIIKLSFKEEYLMEINDILEKFNFKGELEECNVFGSGHINTTYLAKYIENRKRNIQMKFYVTEEEKRLIDEKMKQLPIKQYGAYFRKMAIDGYILVVDRSDTKAYIRELQAVSRNINQIAKRANATGTVYRQDIEDIKKAVDEIWRLQRRTLLNQP